MFHVRLRNLTGDTVSNLESNAWKDYHIIWEGFGIDKYELDVQKVEEQFED